MFNFSKKEVYSFFVVLLVIIAVTYLNILVSYRNEREEKRNLDITEIAKGVEKFRNEYGEYPLSDDDGKILACRGENTKVLRGSNGLPVTLEGAKKYKIEGYAPCNWGKADLGDVEDVNYPRYLSVIPSDPQEEKGVSYFYVSDSKEYKIYASYESKYISDYNESIKKLGLKCGIRACNVGRTIGAGIIQ